MIFIFMFAIERHVHVGIEIFEYITGFGCNTFFKQVSYIVKIPT